MKYEMKLSQRPFNQIKNGTKIIEMRLKDEKRKNIQKNDYIEFSNCSTGEKLMCIVVDLFEYETFEELYANHDKKDLGYIDKEYASHIDMLQYYSQHDIEKYGVLAIKIQVCKTTY